MKMGTRGPGTLVPGLIAALALGLAPVRAQQPAFNIVGYYADWTAARYPLLDIPGNKLTHINYAFAKVSPDNTLVMVHPESAVTLFPQVAQVKQKFPRLKFIVSVGGWTDSSGFYEMAATEQGRQTFADSGAQFLKTNPQFDGIDIDWEHPVVGGLQRALGQPRDAQNYVSLLQQIRKAIGPNHLLTIAIGAGPNVLDPLDWPAMTASIDWVSIMTYDFHTGGPRTGYNSPLYDNKDPDNPKHNLHDAVQTLIEKGTPRAKIAAGLPFYSHAWRGVESPNVWSPATATFQAGNYRTLASNLLTNPAFVRSWDDVAKVPSLYNAQTKEWVSYDDPQSIRLKGEYIAAQRLGGAMYWEMSGDDGPLLDALRAGLGIK